MGFKLNIRVKLELLRSHAFYFVFVFIPTVARRFSYTLSAKRTKKRYTQTRTCSCRDEINRANFFFSEGHRGVKWKTKARLPWAHGRMHIFYYLSGRIFSLRSLNFKAAMCIDLAQGLQERNR